MMGSEEVDRTFHVLAVELDVVYSHHPRLDEHVHNPNNAMYVLEENLEDAKEAAGEPLDNPEVDSSLLEPLVIRANRGELVEIVFHNKLKEYGDTDRPASMHQTSLPYPLDTSDGMMVGENEDSTVAPGERTTYRWHANEEGTHFFLDAANPAHQNAPNGNPGEVNLTARGLFGALMVEPPEATWSDPEDGGELPSGTRAIIHDPNKPDHREFVIFYHNAEGAETPWGNDDEGQKIAGLNYRAIRTAERVKNDNADFAKKTFYSSEPHGDPAAGDAVFETYAGDPVKMAVVSASPEENHVHHLHGHRWRRRPVDQWKYPFDSITLGMGGTRETFLAAGFGEGTTRTDSDWDWEKAFAVGAGYAHDGVGDYLFHCHLFPHYAEGMNAFMRVIDEENDDLEPLDNNPPPFAAAGDDEEGFPDYLPAKEADGEHAPAGEKLAPKPPDRETRETELSAREDALGATPGAPYTHPADVEDDFDEPAERREYTVRAVETDIRYNDGGDHDPRGIAYVLEEHLEQTDVSELNPEPLFIRANVGDVVEVTFKNRTSTPLSLHPHFVGFDVVGSDGAEVGFNYDSGVAPGEEGTYLWYADEEGPVYLHDHMSGLDVGMNGPFGVLLVEPKGSRWLDPYTGEELEHGAGAKAMIVNHDDEDFREFALAYHDFAQLRDSDGDYVTERKQHKRNEGVMGINFRNAPYYRRLKNAPENSGRSPKDGGGPQARQSRAAEQARQGGNEPDDRGDEEFADPAYAHSSARLGDPPTPVLETYPDDPVRIRLVQTAWEEFHNFTLHGHHPADPERDVSEAVSQIIGPSEQFTFHLPRAEEPLTTRMDNTGEEPIRDYLYGSTIEDDLGNGMWGVYRVFGAEVDHLAPLPDQGAPADSIPPGKLAKLGHPAPFDRRGELGQLATLDNRDARRNQHIGDRPDRATDAGDVAPDDDGRVRRYELAAVQTNLEFNDYGDHNPEGIVFVPLEDADAVACGEKNPEPLVLRANRGDVVELELHNRLPDDLEYNPEAPQIRAEPDQQPFPRSSRISLHPQKLQYDVQGSDGSAVGFNRDSTVPAGETGTYRWKVDDETESTVLWDVADVVNNWQNGACGQLLVEPRGSSWYDPETGETLTDGYGTRAIIDPPNEEAFREYALTFTDGMYILGADGECVLPRGEDEDDRACNQMGDGETQGFGAVNLRSEPFRHRFEEGSDKPHQVYSTRKEHDDDLATPVFEAFAGDRVVFRVSQAGAKSRGVSFHLANHQWRRYPDLEDSPLIGLDDRLTPGKTVRVEPVEGAGGQLGQIGDFLFQELKQEGRLEEGMWGIFRVREPGDSETNIVSLSSCHA